MVFKEKYFHCYILEGEGLTLILFRNACFKERIFISSSAIYFFKLFLLSRKRVRKTIGLLRKFQNILAKASKLFLRPHLDHGDIVMLYVRKHTTSNFLQKLESFQDNASLAITERHHKRNFERKIYQELGKGMVLETLMLFEDLQ